MTATVIRFPVERRAEPVAPEAVDWAVQAHTVLDAAERLMAQQPADVVRLCRQAFDLLASAEADIDDEPTMLMLAGRLGALHRRACEAAGDPLAERSYWLVCAWRRCPTLARQFDAGATHPAGGARPISAAVAGARRRHPTAARARRSTNRTAG